MNKFIFFICAALCCTIFADWHTWEKPPKKGQRYMTVNLCPGVKVEHRQILIISYYYPRDPIVRNSSSGWWDAESEDILRWCNEGSKVLYLPCEVERDFVERMSRLIK